jgi:hypothetical protein
MTKSTHELLLELKNEFPEIFDKEEISLSRLGKAIRFCEEYDRHTVVRSVLLEKQGNITGKKQRLLNFFIKLDLA